MITATIVLCPYCGGRTWQKKCYIRCCECGKKLEEWEDTEET